ncbi:glycoside hydrolase family 43 protein [Cohnella terricola]|uniref:Family 43 glycosylhydrolase n=1 Tax=Cohnella terricola TaxID=1289167 RepID=A0A559JTW5_9BACL|nr:glycoside hydrolase family 43 protein [Cohnella terricola]TVY03323.1 family 43 glycosylhydrolase [Cohnella terricola]
MDNAGKGIVHLPVMGEGTYVNPLPQAGAEGAAPVSDVHPDPYVLKYNGIYYAYATGEAGVLALLSKDGVNWEHRGYVYRREGFVGYWAPAVVYENGTFYMYVSSRPEGEEDVHKEFLHVAIAERAEGPFEYVRTLYDTFSLDAHVVKDEAGDYYLFYSNNEYSGVDAERPGTVILADRLLDMTTPEGKPQLIVAPSIDEEIYEENRFGDGRDWHTIEGAFYVRRDDRHYMMYSGNAYVRPNYFIGYSSAPAREEGGLMGLDWTKHPSDDRYAPLLRKNDGVEGVGHNSVVRGPNNVDEWVYYHGRNAADELDFDREQRTMRADPLLWCGERMWMPGPTHEAQDVPALPALRELFDSGEGGRLSPEMWEELAGEWEVCDGEVTQRVPAQTMSVVTARSFGSLVLEVSVKWRYDHRGGRYGVYACYVDESNFVACILDVGRRQLETYAVSGGVKHGTIRVSLPSKFRFDVYHTFRIEKTGGSYAFKLDDTELAVASYPHYTGRIGLVTFFTSASFAGVEATEYLALRRGTESGFASTMSQQEGNGTAEAAESKLHCRSRDGRTAWLIDWEPARRGAYRFAFDLKLALSATYAGAYAAFDADGAVIECRLVRRREAAGRSGSSEGRAEVVLRSAGGEAALAVMPMTAEFDWSAAHTFDMTVRSGRLFVRLDDMLLYDGNHELADAGGVPGLVICGGQADFGLISLTGIQ